MNRIPCETRHYRRNNPPGHREWTLGPFPVSRLLARLEAEPQRQLDLARSAFTQCSAKCLVQFAESRAREVVVWLVEVGMIEDVKDFRSEFQ